MKDRDRRALAGLGIVLLGALTYWLATRESTTVRATSSADSVAFAEKRLAKLRKVAATLPEKEQISARADTELKLREKGLIASQTAAQAQAQLLQVLRKVAKAQTPEPLDVRATDLGQPHPFGADYGEVVLTVSMDCRIEQLVNFLADLSAQPELIATRELLIGAAHPLQKVIPVRMTVSGVVQRRLVPEKKGLASF